MKNKLGITEYLGNSSVMERIFQKIFYPKYFCFECKTLHIGNNKLAYDAITWMECKPWTLTEVCTFTNSERLLNLPF